MNKKLGLLFLAILILPFLMGILNSQGTDIPGLPSGVNPPQIENTTNQVTNVALNWQTIAQQWKTSLLQNPVVYKVNSFFQDISIVFRVLFGQNYSMSLTLLIIIILWIFFLISLNRIFKDFTSFSKGVSFIISLLLVVVMAQINLLGAMSTFIIKLIFGTNNPLWMQLLFAFIIAMIILFIMVLIKKFGKQSVKKRQEKKDEENRFKLESEVKAGEPLAKEFEKEGNK